MPPNIPPKKIKKTKDAKDTLRRCVENLFNHRYGMINVLAMLVCRYNFRKKTGIIHLATYNKIFNISSLRIQ